MKDFSQEGMKDNSNKKRLSTERIILSGRSMERVRGERKNIFRLTDLPRKKIKRESILPRKYSQRKVKGTLALALKVR